MEPLPTRTADLPSLAAALDALPEDRQRAWIHGLSKREMRALWELAAPIDLGFFHGGEGEIVRHEGQNDLLPGVDHFEKHMVLRGGAIQGINVGWTSTFVGDGHFVLRQDDTGVYVDYTTVAKDAPAGWPTPKDNMAGLSRLVYGGTKDYMRKVTGRISIGRAYFADGRDRGHFFVMFRRSPPAP